MAFYCCRVCAQARGRVLKDRRTALWSQLSPLHLRVGPRERTQRAGLKWQVLLPVEPFPPTHQEHVKDKDRKLQ